jgi:formylglycine-generating enzyme required for sulfatase activity
VSFAQAQNYVQWLSRLTGARYRLPNKAEAKAWQKKAHQIGAKENTLNYWAGYDITWDEVPALRKKLAELQQSLVMEAGSFPPTELGDASVYDLGGNLAEYVADGSTYGYSAYDYVDPNSERVRRSAMHTGFRVVKE